MYRCSGRVYQHDIKKIEDLTDVAREIWKVTLLFEHTSYTELRAPALYRLLRFQSQILCPYFFTMVIPNYIFSSSVLCTVSEQICFYSVSKLEAIPDCLSRTAYSIYPQLTPYLEVYSATCNLRGCTILWCQEPQMALIPYTGWKWSLTRNQTCGTSCYSLNSLLIRQGPHTFVDWHYLLS